VEDPYRAYRQGGHDSRPARGACFRRGVYGLSAGAHHSDGRGFGGSLFNSSEKRLARALLLLAHFGKEEEPETVIANISQATLAEMIPHHPLARQFFYE
jgi:hypothetical protein